MIEEWKDIPESNGQYSISNLGRFRTNYILVKTRGKEVIVNRETIYKQNNDSTFYDTSPCGYIHRLVAELFIPNPNNCEQVHHIDGDIHNNCFTNLLWVTPAEHNKITHGGKPFTEEHKKKLSGPNAKKARKGEANGMYGRLNKWGNHTEEAKQKIRDSKLGKPRGHWYNNGIINTLAFTCPEGFTAGRIMNKGGL